MVYLILAILALWIGHKVFKIEPWLLLFSIACIVGLIAMMIQLSGNSNLFNFFMFR